MENLIDHVILSAINWRNFGALDVRCVYGMARYRARGVSGAPRRGVRRGGRRDGGDDGHQHLAAKQHPKRPFNASPVNPQTNDAEQDAVVSSDEEEEIRPYAKQAYSSLLQTFQTKVTNKPPKKRRRITYDGAPGLDPDAIPSEYEANDSDEDDPVNAEAKLTVFDDGEADSDDDQASDPFEVHFAQPNEDLLKVCNTANYQQDIFSTDQSTSKLLRVISTKPDFGTATGQPLPRTPLQSLRNVKLKRRLQGPALESMPKLSDDQLTLAQPLFNYEDVCFGNRRVSNADGLRDLVTLHTLNHLFKTRDRILKNNTRVAKYPNNTDLDCRDQGFTRPKVLFLLETRSSCVKYVKAITKLCRPEQQENYKRFQDAFIQEEEKYSEDKPADFRELFEGNDDNDFRLGLKFTRRTLKFYSQFYASDIIFASPLGLRRAINTDDPKKTDYDFLSSIELMVVDQADAMLMQNWEHVEHAFEHLNLVPKQSHGCDYSRVRKWYLDQHAHNLRQTIVLSAYMTPELNRLQSTWMRNVAGRVKITRSYQGAIAEIGQQIRQTFNRYDSESPVSDPDDRFKYFTSTIIPAIARQISAGADDALGILIFIPSYLDFVRVRNYFTASAETQEVTFGAVSEYTEVPEVRRARSHFFTGRHAVLLYTGRAHHFRRYEIRGVKKVIMYSLPDNPTFYTEVVDGFLGTSLAEGKVDAADAGARAIFSKWDGLSLERIVGTKRVARMLKPGVGDTFDFR